MPEGRPNNYEFMIMPTMGKEKAHLTVERKSSVPPGPANVGFFACQASFVLWLYAARLYLINETGKIALQIVNLIGDGHISKREMKMYEMK